jgi:hypothetical protein
MRKTVSDLIRHASPSRSEGDAVVLMYHRVGTVASVGGGAAVSSAHFAEHLPALQAQFHAVPLVDLIRSLAQGRCLAARWQSHSTTATWTT